jgi:pimeloyl-ACP methyl ester carboxylesterase/uncharacterized RmlC-like cupin family protein
MTGRWTVACAVFALVSLLQAPTQGLQPGVAASETIAVRTVAVDDVTFQYLTAGHGPAIVLLHGYAETSRMWRPLIARLATRFTVIAPDLPGIGGSSIPSGGIDMTSAARRVHALVAQLGIDSSAVVGHDIGLMVAYAYAAQFPDAVDRLVLMDAFLPGVDGWEAIYNNPAIWHFRFNGPTPEALVRGRERTFFEHFWNGFAADPAHSIPEADRRAYAAAYARPGRMRAGWAYFVSFQKAADDFAVFARTPLTMPVLAIGGEQANGAALAQQVLRVATNARGITLPRTGHWVMEENPEATMKALAEFLDAPAASHTATGSAQAMQPGPEGALPQLRMTPAEIVARQTGTGQIGSSLLPGVSTKVLAGDPSASGFYTIILSVPPHTSIAAHTHRDNRMATVVSGTWHFGYGDRFDERALKQLPPGSVYSEPGGASHFARTGDEAVLVQITGMGPTDTRYVNPADTPESAAR